MLCQSNLRAFPLKIPRKGFSEQEGMWGQKIRVLGTKEIGVIHRFLWQILSTIPRSIGFADGFAWKPSLRFFERLKYKGVIILVLTKVQSD